MEQKSGANHFPPFDLEDTVKLNGGNVRQKEYTALTADQKQTDHHTFPLCYLLFLTG